MDAKFLNISKEALNVFESDAFFATEMCHSSFFIIKEFGKGIFNSTFNNTFNSRDFFQKHFFDLPPRSGEQSFIC